MIRQRTAIYYKDLATGKEPAREWLESLTDRMGQARISAKILRAERGNFGDFKSVGEGVMELRIPVGPGYRLYYALEGEDVILLLLGGDKSTQSKDIEIARKYWISHKAEKS